SPLLLFQIEPAYDDSVTRSAICRSRNKYKRVDCIKKLRVGRGQNSLRSLVYPARETLGIQVQQSGAAERQIRHVEDDRQHLPRRVGRQLPGVVAAAISAGGDTNGYALASGNYRIPAIAPSSDHCISNAPIGTSRASISIG